MHTKGTWTCSPLTSSSLWDYRTFKINLFFDPEFNPQVKCLQTSEKVQQYHHLYLSLPLVQSHLPSTSTMQFSQRAGEYQKWLHHFDSHGFLAFFSWKKEKRNPGLYLKFNCKAPSERMAVDFTRYYGLNLLLTWCLWLLDGSNQLGNSHLHLCPLLHSEWNSREKWGLSSMQVSACVSQVLGNEPTELPKVCIISQIKPNLTPTPHLVDKNCHHLKKRISIE